MNPLDYCFKALKAKKLPMPVMFPWTFGSGKFSSRLPGQCCRSFDSPAFTKSLQLLRVVAAPGVGKSTVLREVWTRLYQLAHEVSNGEDSDLGVACLSKRILSSSKPSKAMVFVLDLMRSDLQQLHPLEETLRANVSGVLALRMLYSRTAWMAAAILWTAVFAVDEAGAAVPAPTSQKPSWLQAALSHFVMLRKTAAELKGNGELLSMPVVTLPAPAPQPTACRAQPVGTAWMLSQTLCLLAGSSVLHNSSSRPPRLLEVAAG
ncbi:hypothetical protein WJX77_006468 [Trebouxia sp. C0004]